MRVLYGVQGTGNGHISRARALVNPLQQAGFELDFVFSGRARDQFFAMEAFGEFRCFQGLTLQTNAGRLSSWQTARHANIRQLFSDIRQLDTRSYDVVITDFEPVTAWAARQQQTLCIGLGHQYAFGYDIPKVPFSLIQQLLFKYFAPANDSLGLHWHHFDVPLLPPLLHLNLHPADVHTNQVLVYLPFESIADIQRWLLPLTRYQFVIVHPKVTGTEASAPHLHWQKPDLHRFAEALQQAQAVLSNAGFELISEALQLKKRILVKALRGQPEQASNAKALQQLQVADVCHELSTERIEHWLWHYQPANHLQFADVAAAFPELLRQRLELGCWPKAAIQALWQPILSRR